jgi:hypothetical protein
MVDRPPQPADDDNTNAQQRRRLIRTLVGAGLLVLGMLVVLLLACVLWIPRWMYPPLTNNDLRDVKTAQNELDAAKVQELKDARLKLQNDARTTLLQGLGALLLLTGAGIGATVTLRQVRVSQEGLHATREQMQHTLETTRQQLNLTEQGQVTDRYTRAVEQLGHERAPVRLGALYSLDHLAQDNPEYRQTVVDVFCAYLRMPYTPPAESEPGAEQVEQAAFPAEDRARAPHHLPGQDPAQELQVRQTAQGILGDHLRLPPEILSAAAQRQPPSTQWDFWPGITLDLTGATLVNLDFASVSVVHAWFRAATFQGYAGFNGATFQGYAGFDRATFESDAWFGEVAFQGDAGFNMATFQEDTRFNIATFQEYAGFSKATFQGDVWFSKATFQRYAEFREATFQGNAWFGATIQQVAGFDKATFRGNAEFDTATFRGDARFGEATFQGYAGFNGATFESDAWFGEVAFQGDARFNGATFAGDNSARGVAGAHVLHLDDPDLNKRRVWPDGCTIRPDPADPSRGTLVLAEQAEEPEPAVPPPPTDRRDA